jgi:hypothetical protein
MGRDKVLIFQVARYLLAAKRCASDDQARRLPDDCLLFVDHTWGFSNHLIRQNTKSRIPLDGAWTRMNISVDSGEADDDEVQVFAPTPSDCKMLSTQGYRCGRKSIYKPASST